MRKKPKQSIMVLWLLPQNPTLCSADTYVSLGGSNGCADQLTNWDGTQKDGLGALPSKKWHGLVR